jgi:hypothetical protein
MRGMMFVEWVDWISVVWAIVLKILMEWLYLEYVEKLTKSEGSRPGHAVLIARDRDFDSLTWRLCNVNIVRCTYLLMRWLLRCSHGLFTRAIRLSHDAFGPVGSN